MMRQWKMNKTNENLRISNNWHCIEILKFVFNSIIF
jgi:hypothetical protein